MTSKILIGLHFLTNLIIVIPLCRREGKIKLFKFQEGCKAKKIIIIELMKMKMRYLTAITFEIVFEL